MKEYGIYTLANDAVHDQLIALINSIEANVEKEIPICVIPYDNQLSLVNQVIAERPNVTLFDKQESLQRWENFAKDIWATHPQVLENRFKEATYPHIEKRSNSSKTRKDLRTILKGICKVSSLYKPYSTFHIEISSFMIWFLCNYFSI